MAARVGTNGPNTARADGPNVRGMSTSIECPGLIVGVDGSAASKAAVDWAARDASMRSVSLTLVHVASGLAGTWPQTPPPIGFGEWQQQRGRRIIDEAVSIVEEANTGGMTCHAAIVAASWAFPASSARARPPGSCTTARRSRSTEPTARCCQAASRPAPRCRVADRRAPAEPQAEVTGTKLYVNLADAGDRGSGCGAAVDGVGLLRAEFMLTDALGGRHPRDLIAHGEQSEFVDRMADVAAADRRARSRRARSSTARPTSAPTSSAAWKAATQFEPAEDNPMIGYRGCYRYVQRPDAVRARARGARAGARADARTCT